MGAKFPKEEDFFGAAQALVRLQDTYELNMTQLARGNLWGRQTRAGNILFSSLNHLKAFDAALISLFSLFLPRTDRSRLLVYG